MQHDTTACKKRFPPKFCDIGERSFEWVWTNKKEFVDFTLTEMTQTTGLFKDWQNYCIYKQTEHATEKDKETT